MFPIPLEPACVNVGNSLALSWALPGFFCWFTGVKLKGFFEQG